MVWVLDVIIFITLKKKLIKLSAKLNDRKVLTTMKNSKQSKEEQKKVRLKQEGLKQEEHIVKDDDVGALKILELEKEIEKLQRQNEVMLAARKEDKEKIIAGEEADNKLKAFIENYNRQINETEQVYNSKINELTQAYSDKIKEITDFYENKINNITNMLEEQNQTVIMLFDLIDTSHEMQQKYYRNFKSLIISDTKEN